MEPVVSNDIRMSIGGGPAAAGGAGASPAASSVSIGAASASAALSRAEESPVKSAVLSAVVGSSVVVSVCESSSIASPEPDGVLRAAASAVVSSRLASFSMWVSARLKLGLAGATTVVHVSVTSSLLTGWASMAVLCAAGARLSPSDEAF